ncbi:MAG: methyltransferase domain-containing protein [Clostridia bacterium]
MSRSRDEEPYMGLARLYDEVRPDYPEMLFRDLVADVGWKKDTCILELGAGTGKATLPLAERGCIIHALEPGTDMAEVFREKTGRFPGITLDAVPFEQWDPKDNRLYEVILCAQAFHWLDEEARLEKCRGLLREKGFLVLLFYSPVPWTDDRSQALNQELQVILDRHVPRGKPGDKNDSKKSYGVQDAITEMKQDGMFELFMKREYRETVRNTPRQFLNAYKTVPALAAGLDALDEGTIQQMDREREDVLARHGGLPETAFDFTMLILRKKSLPVAPCGMDCTLCLGYQRSKNQCPGCNGPDIGKPEHCVKCSIRQCGIRLSSGNEFCVNCLDSPCRRLRELDKRYRTRYGMSMLENLGTIRNEGIKAFMRGQAVKWTCPHCKSLLCVHRGKCLACGNKNDHYPLDGQERMRT